MQTYYVNLYAFQTSFVITKQQVNSLDNSKLRGMEKMNLRMVVIRDAYRGETIEERDIAVYDVFEAAHVAIAAAQDDEYKSGVVRMYDEDGICLLSIDFNL